MAATDFFCSSHALLGESRGYCTKTKQEWPYSGSTLENIFVKFTKLIPRRIFFCIAKILMLMVMFFNPHPLNYGGETVAMALRASPTGHPEDKQVMAFKCSLTFEWPLSKGWKDDDRLNQRIHHENQEDPKLWTHSSGSCSN